MTKQELEVKVEKLERDINNNERAIKDLVDINKRVSGKLFAIQLFLEEQSKYFGNNNECCKNGLEWLSNQVLTIIKR